MNTFEGIHPFNPVPSLLPPNFTALELCMAPTAFCSTLLLANSCVFPPARFLMPWGGGAWAVAYLALYCVVLTWMLTYCKFVVNV